MNFNTNFAPSSDSLEIEDTVTNRTATIAEILCAVMNSGGKLSLELRSAFEKLF